MSMKYLSVAEARDLPGLRLALTAGVPGPYSMAARAVLELKHVDYVPVEQVGGGANEDLVAWTGHRNAPVAVYNQEAPRAGWLEILNLAERLGDGPSLFPDDMHERITMVGLINEMAGENGLLWNLRLIMLGLGGPEKAARAAERNPMYADYGYSEAAREVADMQVLAFLTLLDEQLAAQQNAGRDYLVGDRLSAADVYWAYFSQALKTLPEAACPMPGFLRGSYDKASAAVGGCSDALIAHRDRIFSEHLTLPMTF